MSDSNRGYILVAAIAAFFIVGVTGAKELQCQRDYYAQGTYQIEGIGSGHVAPRIDRGWFPCLVETAIAAPKAQGASEKEQRDLIAQESMALWTFWVVVFAGMTTIITGIGTIYIAKQVKLTRQAVEDTSEATEAMREANLIAADTSKRQLRAYVTCEETYIDFARLIEPKEGFVAFELRNAGQTPAYEVTITTHVQFSEIGPDKHRIILRGTDGDDLARTILGPSGGGARHRSSFPISRLQYRDVLAGKLTIILAVIVSYRDAFGRRRLTTGRYFFDPKASPNDKGAYPMRICGCGNAAN